MFQITLTGTIKFMVDHFGYNKYLIEDSSSWVKQIANYKEDSDLLVEEIKNSKINFVSKSQKIMALRLSLSDIWNLKDLIEQVIPSSVKTESFDLKSNSFRLNSYDLICFGI